MTIISYLIRLVVSLFFGFFTMFNIASIYAHMSNKWDRTNEIEVYIGNIVLVAVWFISAYLLYIIK